jgi:hypothetical protein
MLWHKTSPGNVVSFVAVAVDVDVDVAVVVVVVVAAAALLPLLMVSSLSGCSLSMRSFPFP